MNNQFSDMMKAFTAGYEAGCINTKLGLIREVVEYDHVDISTVEEKFKEFLEKLDESE